MPVSNKTGLVFKISVVLFLLLAVVVYKVNDYFRDEKTYTMQSRLRSTVLSQKTTVSSQLAQLRNTLSAYESGLTEDGINWVPLDPFFAVARVQKAGGGFQVSQLLVRSNTPAERWNAAYLEKALTVNRAGGDDPILAQLFKDRAGGRYLILRFALAGGGELAVVGSADYFQKFFDLDRGEKSTSLLATAGGLLAAHSVADYIATPTDELRLPASRFLFEKEPITGTNLIAMTYAPKSQIAGFAVPWSMVGVVAGCGCLLLAVLFYSLDPIERRIERYKKSEREQIYKNTLGDMAAKVSLAGPVNLADPQAAVKPGTAEPHIPEPRTETVTTVTSAMTPPAPEAKKTPRGFYSIDSAPADTAPEEDEVTHVPARLEPAEEDMLRPEGERFLALEDEKIDLSDIEKALALDDFDSDDLTVPGVDAAAPLAPETPDSAAQADVAAADPVSAGAPAPDLIAQNLTPQKISLSPAGAPVTKPEFALARKAFRSDEFQVNIRRPDKA